MTKLKSAASSIKSLASKVSDDLKREVKSLDEVVRVLKKAITEMEATSSQDSNGNPSTAGFAKMKSEDSAATEGSTTDTCGESATLMTSSTTTTNNAATLSLVTSDKSINVAPSMNVLPSAFGAVNPVSTTTITAMVTPKDHEPLCTVATSSNSVVTTASMASPGTSTNSSSSILVATESKYPAPPPTIAFAESAESNVCTTPNIASDESVAQQRKSAPIGSNVEVALTRVSASHTQSVVLEEDSVLPDQIDVDTPQNDVMNMEN